jgi:molybdopterin-biosynthesis enzyme MoeA-like protein
VTKTLRAKKSYPMAIASPKTKEELVRQFRFNPEVNTRLEAFMKAESGLVQFVKELPREQLERKFLLRKMQEHERKRGYDAKVKAWLEKPEQAELVQSLKATISPEMKSERQAQVLVSQAKNYIRNSGLRIS